MCGCKTHMLEVIFNDTYVDGTKLPSKLNTFTFIYWEQPFDINSRLSFFSRLKYGLKIIFGKETSLFNDISLKQSEAEELTNFINKFKSSKKKGKR